MSDRFTVTDLGAEMALRDSQAHDDRYLCAGLDREQAEYAAMVLNSGGVDTDLDAESLESVVWSEVVLRVRCTECDAVHLVGQSSADGRCEACQS